jgi:hypothetical protein
MVCVFRPTPLLWLLLAPLLASPAAAESVWLRGRGSDVWIEVDGRVREPRPDRKGFTRVSSPSPVILRNRVRRAAPAPRPARVVVELGAPEWSGPSYSGEVHHYVPRYRSHRPYRHARYGHRGRHGHGRHRIGHHRGPRRDSHLRGGGHRRGGHVRGGGHPRGVRGGGPRR